MKRFVFCVLALTILMGCRRKTTLEEITITERIDTTITIAPDTLKFRTTLIDIIDQPRVFENDRSKTTVVIRRDTVEVETICKPDTIRIYMDRTTTKRTKTREPVRRCRLWVWFLVGGFSFLTLRTWLLRL